MARTWKTNNAANHQRKNAYEIWKGRKIFHFETKVSEAVNDRVRWEGNIERNAVGGEGTVSNSMVAKKSKIDTLVGGKIAFE